MAESAGLVLDGWQRWVLDQALSERADGKWTAFEVCLLVARQNGKGSILEALELYALFVMGVPLIVHSAHEFKTSREHFLRIWSLIEGTPELLEKCHAPYTANGNESIRLKNGCRLRFVARSRGSLRGFTTDLLVLDEAYELPEKVIGAVLPTLSARPNAQVWYTSSAAHVDSHVLHALIRRDAGRLFLADWGNDPDVDWHDRDARLDAAYRSNPAMGIRISEEAVENEYEAMKELGDEFPRERLGIHSLEDRSSGVFPAGTWGACRDDSSSIVGKTTVALDVSPNMQWATFCIAGTRADGIAHVEIAERRPGTAWVVAEAQLAAKEHGPIWVDPRGPVGGLLDDLERERVPTRHIKDGELSTACAALQEKVLNGTLRHIGQPPLDQAVQLAAIRRVNDSWRWSRSMSSGDISPVVAATVALWAASQGPKSPNFFA